MGNIVGLNQPNHQLVKLLEELTRDAKSGLITSIAAIVVNQHKIDFAIESPKSTTLEMIGALEALKIELLQDN